MQINTNCSPVCPLQHQDFVLEIFVPCDFCLNGGLTAHLDKATMFVVFHCDPVLAMVPPKLHFDVFDVLYCNVPHNTTKVEAW